MKHQGLLGQNSKMATSSVIWFIVCLLVICHVQNTDVRRLNMKINRLSRKTENLENDVDDIWATILTPGKETQDHVNKTRTDNFDTKAKDVTAMMSGTVTDVQELKTEVEQLVLSSRIGFKNEKSWQRGAIRNLTRIYTEFQTGVVEENIELNNHLEELDTKVTKIEKTNEDNQVGIDTINNDLNETMSETGKKFEAQAVINEQVSKILENLSAKQNRLETENQELKQTISEMQKDNQEKLSNMETENQALKQKISEMEKDNQQKLSNLETENQEFKQTISEMQKDNQELKWGLATLQSTALFKPCDDGWESFQHHCYLHVSQTKTWDDASAFCKSKNSYLIEITTDAEVEFAAELMTRHYRYWIGATDRENEGTFVYQHSKLQVPEKHWGRQLDTCNDGTQHYVYMDNLRSSVFKLYYDCTFYGMANFVCQKP